MLQALAHEVHAKPGETHPTKRKGMFRTAEPTTSSGGGVAFLGCVELDAELDLMPFRISQMVNPRSELRGRLRRRGLFARLRIGAFCRPRKGFIERGLSGYHRGHASKSEAHIRDHFDGYGLRARCIE